MNYIKKAKTALKDVQEIQKTFKELSVQFDKKGTSQPTSPAATPSAASPPPSTIAPVTMPPPSTIAPVTMPPPSTIASETMSPPPSYGAVSDFAPSVFIQGGDLSVPHCPTGGHLIKIPLKNRKNVRDRFESRKPELEKEFSDLLGVPWTVHADAVGIYTYTEIDPSSAASKQERIGSLIYEYFDGALSSLKSFKDRYGAADTAIINQLAPSHIITLEPITDERVQYNTTDFHGGHWRLLFRDNSFGVNGRSVGQDLSAVVNAATKSGATASPLSLNAQKSIRDKYEKYIPEVENKARTILNAPTLVFQPNFEANYATLAAFKAANPDELQDDWDATIGMGTVEYFSGFVGQLEQQKFPGDDMMQEGFQDGINRLQVAFVVTPDVNSTYNDCVIENGILTIRAKPSAWRTNCSGACENLSAML